MKNTIKITATMAVLAGLLIAPSVLASEVSKNGTEITVTEPTVEVQKQGDSFYDKVDVTVKTDIPNEAPQVDKPELNINDIPLMPPAPILDKPELDLNDVPLLPPAPVLELQELIVPEEPKSLEKESPAPSTKEEPKNAVESKLDTSANELPKTGEVSNVFLSIFGISLLISGAMIWNDNKKK